MKKIINLSLIALLMLGIAACSDDDKNEPDKIVINNESTTSSLFADQNSGSLAFTATEAWYANVADVTSTKSSEGSNSTTWLELDQYNGPAGTYNLSIILNTNDTQFDRTATITITCGGSSFSVTITQKGTKQDGTKPEAKRLITQITESGSFTSDYYEADAHISEGSPYTYEYTPFTYTFSYDAQNKIKEYIARKNSDNSIDVKAVFDYSIAGEVRLTETDNYNNTDLNRGKLNEQGYITAIVEGYENWNEGEGFNYDVNGYIKNQYDIEENVEWAFFTWKNNNLHTIEVHDIDTFHTTLIYNTIPNNKTNIDLNGFFFGYCGSGGVANIYNDNYSNLYSDDILAMADFFGKRSKNYIININDGEKGNADMMHRYFNEDNEPEQGVYMTRYDLSLDGDYKYTFDSNDYPTTFSYRVKVEKTIYTYNGVREYLPEERQNEWEKFSIKLDPSTVPVKYDTYTYTISYNK